MKTGLVEMIKKDEHLFGLPNLLSFSRLLFLPLICYAITLEHARGSWLALLLFGLSSLTDFFDGYVARQRKQFSELGRILDPVMDKLNIAAIMLFMAAWRNLPYWYVAIVIARDVLILIGSLYVIKNERHVPESNFIGKTTLVVFLLVIVTYLLDLEPYNLISMAVSVALIPVTLIRYLWAYYQLNHSKSAIKA